ncbi:hypothetical protein NFI96_012971 [Prochilodus magdalenae]|nr:hypothetical protein NFI96_012971 [Prochilodus magdalenae]
MLSVGEEIPKLVSRSLLGLLLLRTGDLKGTVRFTSGDGGTDSHTEGLSIDAVRLFGGLHDGWCGWETLSLRPPPFEHFPQPLADCAVRGEEGQGGSVEDRRLSEAFFKLLTALRTGYRHSSRNILNTGF